MIRTLCAISPKVNIRVYFSNPLDLGESDQRDPAYTLIHNRSVSTEKIVMEKT